MVNVCCYFVLPYLLDSLAFSLLCKLELALIFIFVCMLRISKRVITTQGKCCQELHENKLIWEKPQKPVKCVWPVCWDISWIQFNISLLSTVQISLIFRTDSCKTLSFSRGIGVLPPIFWVANIKIGAAYQQLKNNISSNAKSINLTFHAIVILF